MADTRKEKGPWTKPPDKLDEHSKQQQLEIFTEIGEGQHLTTNQGIKSAPWVKGSNC
jgi:hypothetical protein